MSRRSVNFIKESARKRQGFCERHLEGAVKNLQGSLICTRVVLTSFGRPISAKRVLSL